MKYKIYKYFSKSAGIMLNNIFSLSTRFLTGKSCVFKILINHLTLIFTFFLVILISGISLIVLATIGKWGIVPVVVKKIVWDKMELVEGTMGYEVGDFDNFEFSILK